MTFVRTLLIALGCFVAASFALGLVGTLVLGSGAPDGRGGSHALVTLAAIVLGGLVYVDVRRRDRAGGPGRDEAAHRER